MKSDFGRLVYNLTHRTERFHKYVYEIIKGGKKLIVQPYSSRDFRLGHNQNGVTNRRGGGVARLMDLLLDKVLFFF